MILAPNRQLPLSGSNLVLFLVLIFFGIGCTPKTTKPVQTTTNKNLPPKKYDPVQGKNVVDTQVKGPIKEQSYSNAEGVLSTTNSSTNTSEKPEDTKRVTNSQEIALVLPFMGGEYKDYLAGIPKKSTIAVEFYAGAKLALEELNREGNALNVKVYDSQANSGLVDNMIQDKTLASSKLIIGGIKAASIKAMSKYASQNKKAFVSPLIPAINTNENCTSCYQFNPSFTTHSAAILAHAKQTFQSKDIVLLVRSKRAETDRLQTFRALNGGGTPIQEKVVDFPGEFTLESYFEDGAPKCFIIPSWSNESFIQEALRVIRLAKGMQQVTVYGMPQWLDMEKLSYDNFEELNLHVSTAYYIDRMNANSQAFKNNFFNRYGKVPGEFAFKGYDITYYFGKQLAESSSKLMNGTIQGDQLLHTKVELTNQQAPDSYSSGQNAKENRFIQLLRFQDFKFQPIY